MGFAASEIRYLGVVHPVGQGFLFERLDHGPPIDLEDFEPEPHLVGAPVMLVRYQTDRGWSHIAGIYSATDADLRTPTETCEVVVTTELLRNPPNPSDEIDVPRRARHFG
ncbi:hypothetical protein [Sphingomicrobium arenosum]|uniref:hypothetical protein n=1 Tax=Sphingomicrobium arenosum TaxID=2233861 RepID=UPI002240FA51|nr:hypothetical protein [Sphingomicrobium arenosum]